MNQADERLKRQAIEGLRYLFFDSQDFRDVVEGLRHAHGIDMKGAKNNLVGEKLKVREESPEIQLRIAVLRKDYLKKDASSQLRGIFESAKELQKQFFLDDFPIEKIVEYLVLGSINLPNDKACVVTLNPLDLTLEIKVKPHVKKDQFTSIWDNQIKQLKQLAKNSDVEAQRGRMDFKMTFLFYEERQKHPKATRAEITKLVSDRLSKGSRGRIFDNSEVNRNIKKMEDFKRGLSLIYGKKPVANK